MNDLEDLRRLRIINIAKEHAVSLGYPSDLDVYRVNHYNHDERRYYESQGHADWSVLLCLPQAADVIVSPSVLIVYVDDDRELAFVTYDP